MENHPYWVSTMGHHDDVVTLMISMITQEAQSQKFLSLAQREVEKPTGSRSTVAACTRVLAALHFALRVLTETAAQDMSLSPEDHTERPPPLDLH